MAGGEAGGAAQAEFLQARALMVTAMSPLARRVEEILQSELDALNSAPPAQARPRISRLFDRAPALQPGPGIAREIVRAGGNRLITFLSAQLHEDRTAIIGALDDYVGASERFLEPVLIRHMPSAEG